MVLIVSFPIPRVPLFRHYSVWEVIQFYLMNAAQCLLTVVLVNLFPHLAEKVDAMALPASAWTIIHVLAPTSVAISALFRALHYQTDPWAIARETSCCIVKKPFG